MGKPAASSKALPRYCSILGCAARAYLSIHALERRKLERPGPRIPQLCTHIFGAGGGLFGVEALWGLVGGKVWPRDKEMRSRHIHWDNKRVARRRRLLAVLSGRRASVAGSFFRQLDDADLIEVLH